jgi:hypothetical protein
MSKSQADFPHLTNLNSQITSPSTWDYNCIAWAANDSERWWWPTPDTYWPPLVQRAESINSFVDAFATLGYKITSNGNLELGKEKIVLYTDSYNIPTHMARQLTDGQWTSKLGRSNDISHNSPQVIEGPAYGKVSIFLERLI